MLVLPPYPTEVTTLPDVRVNHPDNRSAANYIRTVLQLNPDDPRYRIDQYGTKCNFMFHDVMALMGYTLEWMVANDIYTKLAVGDLTPFKTIVIQDAIMNANQGCPTFGVLHEDGHGHVVTVLPSPTTLNPGELLVMQAGRQNFYGKPMSWSWTHQDLPRVRFGGAP